MRHFIFLFLVFLQTVSFAQTIETDSTIEISYPFSSVYNNGKVWIKYQSALFDHKENDSIEITEWAQIRTFKSPTRNNLTFYYPGTNRIYYKVKKLNKSFIVLFFDINGKSKHEILFNFPLNFYLVRGQRPYPPYIELDYIKFIKP